MSVYSLPHWKIWLLVAICTNVLFKTWTHNPCLIFRWPDSTGFVQLLTSSILLKANMYYTSDFVVFLSLTESHLKNWSILLFPSDRRSHSHDCIMLASYTTQLKSNLSLFFQLELGLLKFLDSFVFCLECLWSPRHYEHKPLKYLHGQFYSHEPIEGDQMTEKSPCLQNTR